MKEACFTQIFKGLVEIGTVFHLFPQLVNLLQAFN